MEQLAQARSREGDRHHDQHPILLHDPQAEQPSGQPNVQKHDAQESLGRIDIGRPAAIAQSQRIQVGPQREGQARRHQRRQRHRHDHDGRHGHGRSRDRVEQHDLLHQHQRQHQQGHAAQRRHAAASGRNPVVVSRQNLAQPEGREHRHHHRGDHQADAAVQPRGVAGRRAPGCIEPGETDRGVQQQARRDGRMLPAAPPRPARLPGHHDRRAERDQQPRHAGQPAGQPEQGPALAHAVEANIERDPDAQHHSHRADGRLGQRNHIRT